MVRCVSDSHIHMGERGTLPKTGSPGSIYRQEQHDALVALRGR
jgi:hypothetical protein